MCQVLVIGNWTLVILSLCACFTASGANYHIIHLLLISSRSGPPKPATMKLSWLDDAIVASMVSSACFFLPRRPAWWTTTLVPFALTREVLSGLF